MRLIECKMNVKLNGGSKSKFFLLLLESHGSISLIFKLSKLFMHFMNPICHFYLSTIDPFSFIGACKLAVRAYRLGGAGILVAVVEAKVIN